MRRSVPPRFPLLPMMARCSGGGGGGVGRSASRNSSWWLINGFEFDSTILIECYWLFFIPVYIGVYLVVDANRNTEGPQLDSLVALRSFHPSHIEMCIVHRCYLWRYQKPSPFIFLQVFFKYLSSSRLHADKHLFMAWLWIKSWPIMSCSRSICVYWWRYLTLFADAFQ
jgi:hypothetical protein